jgi:hypothetical protein
MRQKVTPTAAAKQWLETLPTQKEQDRERQHDEAAKVLKEHCRTKGLPKFRGVQYASSTYTALDIAKARELLGNKASQAEVTRTRETLSPAA